MFRLRERFMKDLVIFSSVILSLRLKMLHYANCDCEKVLKEKDPHVFRKERRTFTKIILHLE